MQWVRRFESEKEFWVERESFLSREKWENENRIAPQLYIEKCSSMDWGVIEIYRALNLDRHESVKVLLWICRQQKYLDGSRSCRESIGQKKSFLMNWEAVEKLSRQIPESSMDQNCANFHHEKKKEGLDKCKSIEKLSSLKKMSFSKRGKTHRDECNKQATQT